MSLPKRIQNKIEIIELKREFGLADLYFHTWAHSVHKHSFSVSCSKEKYLKYHRLIDDPDEILHVLTDDRVVFMFENRRYTLKELQEEMLILKLAKIFE